MKYIYVVVTQETDRYTSENTVEVIGVYEREETANAIAKEQLDRSSAWSAEVTQHILL